MKRNINKILTIMTALLSMSMTMGAASGLRFTAIFPGPESMSSGIYPPEQQSMQPMPVPAPTILGAIQDAPVQRNMHRTQQQPETMSNPTVISHATMEVPQQQTMDTVSERDRNLFEDTETERVIAFIHLGSDLLSATVVDNMILFNPEIRPTTTCDDLADVTIFTAVVCGVAACHYLSFVKATCTCLAAELTASSICAYRIYTDVPRTRE